MAGIDSNTKLMLHMNGSDGSTTFTDDSDSAHTITAQADAQIDTAQSKFGGASGLFDGITDKLTVPNSTDWDWGSSDFTIDCWIRFSNTGSFNTIFSRGSSVSNYVFLGFVDSTTLRFRDINGSIIIGMDRTVSISINTWYHVAVTRNGNDFRLFLDGVQQGSTLIDSDAITSRTNQIQIGSISVLGASTSIDGWLDEFRISKGIARWTSNFTPPTQEYNDDIIVSPSVLTINSSIESIQTIVDAIITPDPLTITSELLPPFAIGEVLKITPNVLTISSSIETPTTISDVLITPNILTITSSLETPIFPVIGSLIAKIISVNPLIAVTDTSPVKIIKIDTTDPENLVYESVTLANINNAKDVAVNSTNDFVYVAGSSGKVVKVEIADLTNQITFDLSDTDNLLTIETNSNFGITYAGTENTIGELYTIDERSTFKLDTDFQALQPNEFQLDTDFNIVETFRMDSNFNALSQQTFAIDTDFKCLTKELVPITSIDDIVPINLTDYQIFIDSVELGDTDLILNSISITHSVAEQSRASFQLTRKHDQLNTTLEGVSSTITNQNNVEIKIRGRTEFSGQISELDCQYNNQEFIIVNALAEEKINILNNITLSLPGINSRLSLYDVLIQNPKIFNPFSDPNNEDNPPKFKGIRVNLGTRIKQSLSRYLFFDSDGSIAEEIQEGTFNPIQNWTYFWSPTANKFGSFSVNDSSNIPEATDEELDFSQIRLPVFTFEGVTPFSNLPTGDKSIQHFLYIGTSLAPVSEELWNLNVAKHRRQRIYDDIETELGFFEVGEAPFQEISVRNGIKITKSKLVDEQNGLFSIKDASFNFQEFAKLVANLELEKLKNINGNILPETSCSLTLTIDGYFYYDISLLTRINIDNSTQANIYNNTNGFPVSVKSITITSADRKVTIEGDNLKSVKELEIIDGQFPDEDDNEYNEEELRILIALKSDMRTRLAVE